MVPSALETPQELGRFRFCDGLHFFSLTPGRLYSVANVHGHQLPLDRLL